MGVEMEQGRQWFSQHTEPKELISPPVHGGLVLLDHRMWWLPCIGDTKGGIKSGMLLWVGVCLSAIQFSATVQWVEGGGGWMSHLATAWREWEEFASREESGCWELAAVLSQDLGLTFGRGQEHLHYVSNSCIILRKIDMERRVWASQSGTGL